MAGAEPSPAPAVTSACSCAPTVRKIFLYLMGRILLPIPAGDDKVCVPGIQRLPLLVDLPDGHPRRRGDPTVRQICGHPVADLGEGRLQPYHHAVFAQVLHGGRRQHHAAPGRSPLCRLPSTSPPGPAAPEGLQPLRAQDLGQRLSRLFHDQIIHIYEPIVQPLGQSPSPPRSFRCLASRSTRCSSYIPSSVCPILFQGAPFVHPAHSTMTVDKCPRSDWHENASAPPARCCGQGATSRAKKLCRKLSETC